MSTRVIHPPLHELRGAARARIAPRAALLLGSAGPAACADLSGWEQRGELTDSRSWSTRARLRQIGSSGLLPEVTPAGKPNDSHLRQAKGLVGGK